MKKLFAFALCLTALLILCTLTASAVTNTGEFYVEDAKKIDEIQAQMRACVQALERIKTANLPTELPKEHAATADAVADEIASTLEAMMGTTDEPAPKAEPNHPNSNTTSRFTNLQFGRNYDPTK